MADQKKKTSSPTTPSDDSLLNLKFAEAESDLHTRNGGLGPTSNVYVSDDENQEISSGEGPIDRQGQRRGQADNLTKGDSAGAHK